MSNTFLVEQQSRVKFKIRSFAQGGLALVTSFYIMSGIAHQTFMLPQQVNW